MSTPYRRTGWWKSSYSAAANGCVEVAFTDQGVEIRDDKLAESPIIRFSFAQWSQWLDEIVHDKLTNTNGAVTVTIQDNTWLVQQEATGATLMFTEQEWTSFRLGVRDGEFALTAATERAGV